MESKYEFAAGKETPPEESLALIFVTLVAAV